MKNLILSLIAASAMLASPNIHAMAGYSFHFDKPNTESVPLDAYISSMLPADMRASKEYRDELYKLKSAMGIKKPIIVRKATLEGITCANARNTSILGLIPHAIIQLDESYFTDYVQMGHSWMPTQTIAHELGHVKKEHQREQNTLHQLHGASMAAVLLLGVMHPNKLRARSLLSIGILSCIYTKQRLSAISPKSDQERIEEEKRHEREAESEGFAIRAQCGYRKAIAASLEHEHRIVNYKLYSEIANIYRSDYCHTPEIQDLNKYLSHPEEFVHKTREELATDIKKILTPAEQDTNYSPLNPFYWFSKPYPQAAEEERTSLAQSLASKMYTVLHVEPAHGSPIHPNHGELISYANKALKNCNLSVDPATTKDTPTLMRNGSPTKPCV